ncbi:MAG: hypothetical protein AVDCRST_MAG49-2348 [uncultured Thermomicrobiales bacterium]|uniref:N-acetyltransferase domain-containing protein n=1 Tax=uncultured Thermomicrobiales bacterium TaxID=1645740 RepID=A0A6J4UUM3_9BACT|nr:MAG: hypothetical protein AVDCRST_MAG49-2348 [uncultured Thermomicrobiales bacterium]
MTGSPAPGAPRDPVFRFRPVAEADAVAIAGWRYPPPYDLYDLDPDDWHTLLDPAAGFVVADLLPAPTAPVAAPGGAAPGVGAGPVGFAVFGAEARVPGAERAGLYDPADRALDIGLGLRPDLTGRGLGPRYVGAVLAAGADRHDPPSFRLAVARSNGRAIRAYQRVGFVPGPTFASPVRGVAVEVEFLLMTRPRTLCTTAAVSPSGEHLRADPDPNGRPGPDGSDRQEDERAP